MKHRPFASLILPLLLSRRRAGPAQLRLRSSFEPKREEAHLKAPGEEETSGTAQAIISTTPRQRRTRAKFKRRDQGLTGSSCKNIRMMPSLGVLVIADATMLQEQTATFTESPRQAYHVVVCEKLPEERALRGCHRRQFRLGEIYLNGQKTKFARRPDAQSGYDAAAEIFTTIIRLAPLRKVRLARNSTSGARPRKAGRPE